MISSGCYTPTPIHIKCSSPSVSRITSPEGAARLPFVVGAHITVPTTRVDSHGAVLETYSIESTNPLVLGNGLIASSHDAITLETLAEGTAELVVRRAGGVEQGRITISVQSPTRFALYSRLALLAGRTETAAQVERPLIEVGETASFLMRAYAGEQELQLAGGYVSVATDPADGIALLPGFVADVTLTAWREGDLDAPVDFSVSLLVAEPSLDITFPVRGVSESSVTALALVLAIDPHIEEDECAAVVTLPTTSAGELVEGAEASFSSLSRGRRYGEGEVLNFRYESGEALPVRADVGGASAEITIATRESSLNPANTTGCASGGGDVAAAWMSMLSVIAFVVLRKHARARA